MTYLNSGGSEEPLKPEVLKRGKCPDCHQPAEIILYRGEKRISHLLAADTKECRRAKLEEN